MKLAIILSKFNPEISTRLLMGAKRALDDYQVSEKEVTVFEVPGAFEIPYQAAVLAATKEYNALITLGAVLKGETDHYEAICQGVTYGIQKVTIEAKVPVMFGVLMCETMEQAQERSDETKQNKGYQCIAGALTLIKG